MPLLHTARLTLQPLDRELMLLAIRDPALVGQHLNLRVAPGWPNDVERDALPFLANQLATDPTLADWSMHLIIDHHGQIVIGSGGFKGRPIADGTVELGYGIDPGHQGRGYATEAAQGFIAWAFTQPTVQRIFADCLIENRASARVLEKAGFQPLPSTGEFLNWELRRASAGHRAS